MRVVLALGVVAVLTSACQLSRPPGTVFTFAGSTSDRGPGSATDAFMTPGAVAVSGSSFYVADTPHDVIRRVDADGSQVVVAGTGVIGNLGDGGPATAATLASPRGLAVDGSGNLVIADSKRIRVVAVTTGTFDGQAMTAGDIYTIAGGGSPGQPGATATSVSFVDPTSLAVDSAGNVLVGSGLNGTLTSIWVVPATTGTFYGQAMAAGDIYPLASFSSTVSGCMGVSAAGRVSGIAVDGSGNVIFAANGCVWVMPANSGSFFGQTMVAGNVFSIGGSLPLPPGNGLAVDQAGDVVEAEGYGARVIEISRVTGHVATVAGTGISGKSGDGGPAGSAQLGAPLGVAVDGVGNLVLADSRADRVRVVAASTGTFYGQAMTAGDIDTRWPVAVQTVTAGRPPRPR